MSEGTVEVSGKEIVKVMEHVIKERDALRAENERLRTFFTRIISAFEKNNTWADIVHEIVDIAREAVKPTA